MTRTGTILLSACALGACVQVPHPASLSRSDAQSALVAAMQCVDEDGTTLCLPEHVRSVELDRFDCRSLPPSARELALVSCAVSGALIWSHGRIEELPGRRAEFRLIAGESGRRF